MAIVFDCPHCKTNYRLKDEFAGKTATCKNPNCRKIIPIPQPTTPVGAAKKLDVDALAAALFSDEMTATQAGPGEMIQVTCIGCDHVWSVEAAKEGKNVLCPECRRPNRVPTRKKEEKVDWRTGADGRPTLAKRESGLDVEGAFATTDLGSIGRDTAKKIVDERAAEEEPEVRRKKLIKRGIIGTVVVVLLAGGIYYGIKQRKAAAADAKMEDAVKELTGDGGTKEPKFVALIHRASGEHRIRNASSTDSATEALNDLKTARNKFPASKPDTDRNGCLVEIAITMVDLLGSSDQEASGARFKKDAVVKEIRQTLQTIEDSELCADAIRAITRKAVEKKQPSLAAEVAHLLRRPEWKPDELLGQVGLEMLRIDKDNLRSDAEKLLASAPPTSDAPSIIALRGILGKPAAKKEGEAAPTSLVASAQVSAFKGDTAGIPSALRSAKAEDRVRGLTAAAQMAIDGKPAEATTLLQAAAKEAKESKAYGSPWVAVRICRLLAQVGQFEPAEALAASIGDKQAQAWARLEILRGHLAAVKGSKADDAWLDPVGDPMVLAAAAKAREEIARHNAANGQDYPAIINWEKGKVKPFGTAGTILGKEDRRGQ
jgi:hypothetical protein